MQIPPAIRFLQQDADNLLPHAAALVFEQAPMARFRRGGDGVGQVLPLAAGFAYVQDAMENFPFGGPRPPGPRALGQQGAQRIPLDIRDIAALRLPGERLNLEGGRFS